ncbi:hypothetical protein PATSB16_12470 [Pandoraea thiooxydans]|uniref:Zinc resistance-associated protein n=1 Tax=Pandoraea thiooxydans TaxID=445709 RepID=A0A0G3EQE1_9BURK|nr:Spy/CpxP family protein refolding chaperone [Pandoraea thiooxydans]AKJ67527.1 hypothetical protein ABW99_04055 [Pandoraea thiooxydans]APR94589.1 hypothetical protein PATSB16_12470 [Pandoraea thiooxydans]
MRISEVKRSNLLIACAFAVALFGASQLGHAAPAADGAAATSGYGPGYGPCGGGMGPGMMGGYGGYGGYRGMGPGMMGGYGGYGGMGPGMMGGYGRYGGYGWGSELGLTQEQLAKINRIHDDTRRAHWALMGQIMDQQAKLRDLYEAPQRDNAAIEKAEKDFAQLRQQMYDASIAAHRQIEAVLTKEQRDKLRKAWRSDEESDW